MDYYTMKETVNKCILAAMDAAAQSETAQKCGTKPELHAKVDNYWRVAFTHMGTGCEANFGLLKIYMNSGGMVTVQAGYQTEGISEDDGIIRNFFDKCPHAAARAGNPHIVVCHWKKLQSVLEWSLNAFWNVRVKTGGYAGLTIEEAFLP